MKRLAWIGLFLMTMVLLRPASGVGPDARTRFKIDSHYHYKDEPGFLEKTLQVYRKFNTMVCILTPVTALETVRDTATKNPDVLIPYGSIGLDDLGAIEKIDRFHAAGFKGIGQLTAPLAEHDALAERGRPRIRQDSLWYGRRSLGIGGQHRTV